MSHPAVQALLLGMLAMILIIRRRPRLALAMALLAIGWIWLASTPWLAVRLHGMLASPSPHPTGMPVQRVDAIVVLGGGKLPVHDWTAPDTRAGMGVSLWQQGIAPVVLVSGSDQAKTMWKGMTQSGLPRDAVLVESASDTTHENAMFSAAMLKARGLSRVVLVTSAIHMARAAGAFRHEGIAVTPATVDDGLALVATAPPWMPQRAALTLTARCLRETVALWVYRGRGWS